MESPRARFLGSGSIGLVDVVVGYWDLAIPLSASPDCLTGREAWKSRIRKLCCDGKDPARRGKLFRPGTQQVSCRLPGTCVSFQTSARETGRLSLAGRSARFCPSLSGLPVVAAVVVDGHNARKSRDRDRFAAAEILAEAWCGRSKMASQGVEAGVGVWLAVAAGRSLLVFGGVGGGRAGCWFRAWCGVLRSQNHHGTMGERWRWRDMWGRA